MIHKYISSKSFVCFRQITFLDQYKCLFIFPLLNMIWIIVSCARPLESKSLITVSYKELHCPFRNFRQRNLMASCRECFPLPPLLLPFFSLQPFLFLPPSLSLRLSPSPRSPSSPSPPPLCWRSRAGGAKYNRYKSAFRWR